MSCRTVLGTSPKPPLWTLAVRSLESVCCRVDRVGLTALWLVLWLAPSVLAADRPPNFVVVFCDNLGYGDIGCFGSTKHRTGNIDRMAAEGMKLTSFYSTCGVCTPSRASLMTGCYPRRVSMHLTDPDGEVLRPNSSNGLHGDEITIAEVLKQKGYATACIGKWHLGDQPAFLPTRQGFDEYFGIPYSDDMTVLPSRNWPPLPLMRNEIVIEAPVDRNLLTRRYTAEAIKFMETNRDRPFFLYLPHAMPGSTRAPFASEAFRGKSANGAYGDAVEEIDWSTGEILAALKTLGLDERTLVVWTSDNGTPHRTPPTGSNQPLAGWGYTTMEGGMRVPCLVRWPGKVPGGTTCDQITSTMDFLPTFAKLAGLQTPNDRTIDGHDIWPMLAGRPAAKTQYEAFYFYQQAHLFAVRSGKWKLHLSVASKQSALRDGRPLNASLLYDLESDLAETNNVVDEHPEVVTRLLALAETARADLGDGDRAGKNQRPAGRVANPRPQVWKNPQSESRNSKQVQNPKVE